MRFTTVLLLNLALTGYSKGIAQTIQKTKKLPLRLSVFSQHVSLPSINRLGGRMNPGVKIATERYYTTNKRVSLFQSFDLGYAHHKSLDDLLFVTSEFGIRPKVERFFADIKVGPGFMMSHTKNPFYQYKEHSWAQTGGWQKKLLITAGAGVGYAVKDLAVVLSWKWLLETPYLVNESAVLPRQQLEAGFQIAL